jgi:hypothetical protein
MEMVKYHNFQYLIMEFLKGSSSIKVISVFYFFSIRILWGGVQLLPLGTSATNWPIVLAPGYYENGEFGGMMIGRGNRSIRRKPASVPLCPPQISYDVTGRELWPPRWETND